MIPKQILKPTYKQAIQQDNELQYKISLLYTGRKGNKVTFRTIERWLRQDSDRLTTADALGTIRQHLGLSESEVLTEAKKVAAEPLQN